MESTTPPEIKEKVLKFESFINDVLKEDLKKIHAAWERKTADSCEWIQLKTTIQTMQDSKMTNFKGKMDIGANVYAQVFVPDTSKIIINLGAGVFVEFTLEEALQVIETRIKIVQKELDVINDASINIKARIKLVLHGIQELENIK